MKAQGNNLKRSADGEMPTFGPVRSNCRTRIASDSSLGDPNLNAAADRKVPATNLYSKTDPTPHAKVPLTMQRALSKHWTAFLLFAPALLARRLTADCSVTNRGVPPLTEMG